MKSQEVILEKLLESGVIEPWGFFKPVSGQGHQCYITPAEKALCGDPRIGGWGPWVIGAHVDVPDFPVKSPPPQPTGELLAPVNASSDAGWMARLSLDTHLDPPQAAGAYFAAAEEQVGEALNQIGLDVASSGGHLYPIAHQVYTWGAVMGRARTQYAQPWSLQLAMDIALAHNATVVICPVPAHGLFYEGYIILDAGASLYIPSNYSDHLDSFHHNPSRMTTRSRCRLSSYLFGADVDVYQF